MLLTICLTADIPIVFLIRIVHEVNVLPFVSHRSLMEDVETHEMQILKEQNELEDKKELIELKEVCAYGGGG